MKHIYDIVQDSQGNVLSGISVAVVYSANSVPATLYSQDGISVISNPTVTDANGRFNFYVANGRYDITFTGVNFTPFTQTDVEISDLTEQAATDAPSNVLSINASALDSVSGTGPVVLQNNATLNNPAITGAVSLSKIVSTGSNTGAFTATVSSDGSFAVPAAITAQTTIAGDAIIGYGINTSVIVPAGDTGANSPAALFASSTLSGGAATSFLIGVEIGTPNLLGTLTTEYASLYINDPTLNAGGNSNSKIYAIDVVNGQSRFGGNVICSSKVLQSNTTTDFAGVVSSVSGTTVTKTFNVAYAQVPVVVVTPTTNCGAFYLSTVNTTAFVVTYATTGAQSFNYIVIGNPS